MPIREFPLSALSSDLFSLFGRDIPWWQFEVDTLLLESGISISDISREKLNLLKVIYSDESLFYSNFLFFLHAVEVLNNNLTDFDHLPAPTSLEVAFAIVDMANILKVPLDESPVFSEEVRLTVHTILTNEGYSFPVGPFSIVGTPSLTPGQTKEDTADKLKAINKYVSSISS